MVTTGNIAQRPRRDLVRVDGTLLRLAVSGGLLGGAALILVMGVYEAVTGAGFASILDFCFAAFVFPTGGSAAMTSMSHTGTSAMSTTSSAMGSPTGSAAASGMSSANSMNGPLVASHLAVGAALHVGMSILAGVAFVLVLALLIRSGIRVLSSPAGYVTGGILGGALLYVIMMYLVAPSLNPTIENFTPRIPFFLAHLLFGAIVAGFVYWRRDTARAPAASAAA